METKRNEVTAEYYPDKVSMDSFFGLLSDMKAIKAFKENITRLGKAEDKYPEEWADMFIQWMELNSHSNLFIENQIIIECKHKVYSTSTCTVCWHCPKCGRRGCDNLVGTEGLTIIKKVCEHNCED